MHIRYKNDRIVFIRAWWSKEGKKTIRRQIASCPNYCRSLPETVRTRFGGEKLREVSVTQVFEEKELLQAHSWFEVERKKRESKELERAPWSLSRNLKKATQLVEQQGIEGITEDTAFDVLEHIVAMELALKRIGITKGRLKARIHAKQATTDKSTIR